MSIEDTVVFAMKATEELTVKHCIFQITKILDKEKAITLLREIADGLQAELDVYGK